MCTRLHLRHSATTLICNVDASGACSGNGEETTAWEKPGRKNLGRTHGRVDKCAVFRKLRFGSVQATPRKSASRPDVGCIKGHLGAKAHIGAGVRVGAGVGAGVDSRGRCIERRVGHGCNGVQATSWESASRQDVGRKQGHLGVGCIAFAYGGVGTGVSIGPGRCIKRRVGPSFDAAQATSWKSASRQDVGRKQGHLGAGCGCCRCVSTRTCRASICRCIRGARSVSCF